MPKRLLVAVPVAGLVAGALAIALHARRPPVLRLREAAEADLWGTPPRLEREFKLALRGPGTGPDEAATLQRAMAEALDRAAALPELWKAPAVVGGAYRLRGADDRPYVYRDVYLDTEDRFNLGRGDCCYRIRHRWSSPGKALDHETRPKDKRSYPLRCEVQAKLGRIELQGGYSEAMETRFELRPDSPHFDEGNPPPPSPWALREFLPVACGGKLGGRVIAPAREYARFVREQRPGLDAVRLSPSLVILSRRLRMHLQMKTPWGSGPNPEDAFIITLDCSEVHGPGYLDYLDRAPRGVRERPRPLGAFCEIEIEFERNVSTLLDQAAGAPGADPESLPCRARRAFLEDQARIVSILDGALARSGIRLEPLQVSKYRHAASVLGE